MLLLVAKLQRRVPLKLQRVKLLRRLLNGILGVAVDARVLPISLVTWRRRGFNLNIKNKNKKQKQAVVDNDKDCKERHP